MGRKGNMQEAAPLVEKRKFDRLLRRLLRSEPVARKEIEGKREKKRKKNEHNSRQK